MPNSITLTLDAPGVNLYTGSESDQYDLVFTKEDTKIVIKLSQTALESLPGLANVALPGPGAEPISNDDALWRKKAVSLKHLPDASMQILLRELDSKSLLYVLWFVKDRQLAQTVLSNLSRRAAAMVLDDLISKFQGCDPDAASEGDKAVARQCLHGVLVILQRLIDEGQIAQVPV